VIIKVNTDNTTLLDKGSGFGENVQPRKFKKGDIYFLSSNPSW
jgi:hypothetical protein